MKITRVVVFEARYFMSSKGPERCLIITHGEAKMPADVRRSNIRCKCALGRSSVRQENAHDDLLSTALWFCA